MENESIQKIINELICDTACCADLGCRCWQSVKDLKTIRDYCDSEIKKSRYEDLK